MPSAQRRGAILQISVIGRLLRLLLPLLPLAALCGRSIGGCCLILSDIVLYCPRCRRWICWMFLSFFSPTSGNGQDPVMSAESANHGTVITRSRELAKNNRNKDRVCMYLYSFIFISVSLYWYILNYHTILLLKNSQNYLQIQDCLCFRHLVSFFFFLSPMFPRQELTHMTSRPYHALTSYSGLSSLFDADFADILR